MNPSAAQTPSSIGRTSCRGQLLIWLIPQLLILFFSLAHVPLWLNGPIRMDDLALPQLLCVQIVTAGLLFPCLLRPWDTAMIVIPASWPMIQLAATVSGTPAAQWLRAALYLSIFMAGLALWAGVLRSELSQSIAAGLIGGWVLGGVILVYLHVEYSAATLASAAWSRAGVWNPLLGLLGQLNSAHLLDKWIAPLGLVLSGFVVRLAARWRMWRR